MDLLLDLFRNRRMLFSLSFNDFKTKYTGSFFGVLWAIVQPLATIFVFWFVFQVGLRTTPTDNNVPFSLWLICGLVPWFFFSDALSNATNSFYDYNYLVKKIVFKVSMLPLIKVISSLFIHIVFLLFLLIVYLAYGYSISWISIISILYFSFSTFLLVTSISFITSSVVLFFKDLGQIISIVLQFGMWLTPIMWSTELIPEHLQWIFKINPLYYIVQGYRSSLLYDKWSAEVLAMTPWFWIGVVVTFILGLLCFKKLKPHFADVL
ncbi:ABC transporter permease [Paenibacillus amylolyticus]|uniref:ABC transporter permease n=1 Tax=Paenibacillus amylolyticus TaxID=1451 RepID=UPI000AEA34A2|nr:ABC transporter permease [Paenibacillus amylolyticus]